MSPILKQGIIMLAVMVFLILEVGLAMNPDPSVSAVGMTLILLSSGIIGAVAIGFVIYLIVWSIWAGVKEQQKMNAAKNAAEQVEA